MCDVPRGMWTLCWVISSDSWYCMMSHDVFCALVSGIMPYHWGVSLCRSCSSKRLLPCCLRIASMAPVGCFVPCCWGFEVVYDVLMFHVFILVLSLWGFGEGTMRVMIHMYALCVICAQWCYMFLKAFLWVLFHVLWCHFMCYPTTWHMIRGNGLPCDDRVHMS